MRPAPDQSLWPAWPFYMADLLLVAAGTAAFLHDPSGGLSVALLLLTFLAGAGASMLPHFHNATTFALPPSPEPFSAGGEVPASLKKPEHDDALAEVAVLAWRIFRRAEKDPEAHKVILRNAGRIVDSLARCGVEIISYQGRKIDVGSNVQILDAIPGEYNRVLEESDPQVQCNGQLMRRAVVTIGNGTPPDAPAAPSARAPA